MTTFTKSMIAIVVLVVLGIAIFGAYQYPKQHASLGASPSGTTFNDSKTADISINLASPGANATSSSVLNGDVNDRFITSEKVLCQGVGTSQTAYTGAGLASLTITIATSSTASPTTNGNTNTLPVVTIATSTTQFAISSSTAGTPGNGLVTNVWKAGSYISFFANATNTATCIVGVNYSGS